MAVITTEGKQWIIDKVQNAAPASDANADKIAWGTGSTAEGAGVTFGAQFTEASEARVTGTLSQPAADTDRCVGTLTANGTKTITQVARTNVTTVGGTGQIMFFYALFAGVPLLAGDAITFTLDHQQT